MSLGSQIEPMGHTYGFLFSTLGVPLGVVFGDLFPWPQPKRDWYAGHDELFQIFVIILCQCQRLLLVAAF